MDCDGISEVLRVIKNTLLFGKINKQDFRAEIGAIQLKSLFPNKWNFFCRFSKKRAITYTG